MGVPNFTACVVPAPLVIPAEAGTQEFMGVPNFTEIAAELILIYYSIR